MLITLPLVVAIHLIGAAVTIRHSNQDPVASDQGAEMWLAATSREDVFPQRTDGVRHPLWSWLARNVYTEDQAGVFRAGQMAQHACFVSPFFADSEWPSPRWLDPLATANLLLLCSLGILLVRGTYFQPEPLYYILILPGGDSGVETSPRGADLALRVFGIVCGLAYLSKPSLAPFLAVFCLAVFFRAVLTRLLC